MKKKESNKLHFEQHKDKNECNYKRDQIQGFIAKKLVTKNTTVGSERRPTGWRKTNMLLQLLEKRSEGKILESGGSRPMSSKKRLTFTAQDIEKQYTVCSR